MRLFQLVIPTGAVSRKGERRGGGICFSRIRTALYIVLVAFGAHASDTTNSPRYQKLSHAIMCPCGCNQLLGECNHVGCPDSDKMRGQLAASIDHGDDDTTIFHAFQDEYGPTALAAPMFTRLNQFSWWVPPIVLVLGIGGVFFVVRRWRPGAVAMPVSASDPNALVLEQRVRRETGGDL
ncbi:MAG TPA: cytochrome c-type biogenesis protein CcmH [Acidobacteriaceae bacterium]|jgi:cytochrome c-type biogenesis protein CcmH